MVRKSISALPILLYEFPPTTINYFQGKTKELASKAKKVGTGSTAFTNSLEKIKRNALDENKLLGAINSGRDIRALAHLWLNENDFINRVPISSHIIARFKEVRARLGSLGLYQLTQVFFKFFDRCGDYGAFFSYLLEQCENAGNNDASSELGKFKQNAKKLLVLSAPRALSLFAIKHQVDLYKILAQIGVPINQPGRFQDLCKNFYYLESLKELKFGEDSSLFSQVTQRSVSETLMEGGPCVGHLVIKVLIRKSIKENKKIPDNWLNVILAIAGDPRVPSVSRSYRQWWSQIDKLLKDKVMVALSHFDLKLFLEALNEYSRVSQNDELNRMFPSRKRFLEGLYELGLIGQSRLFLGRRARDFFKRSYRKEKLPYFARLEDPNKSIIYLQVGNLHVIEGSHNSYLWIYDQIPRNYDPLDSDRDSFTVRELGVGLSEKYYLERLNQRLNTDLPYKIQHSPTNFSWQKKALSAFRALGVKIDYEKVFSREDYLKFKRLHRIV